MKGIIAFSAIITAGLVVCACGSPGAQAGQSGTGGQPRHSPAASTSPAAARPAGSPEGTAPPAAAAAAGWSANGVFHGGGPYSTSWTQEGQTITSLDEAFHGAAESARMLVDNSMPVADMDCQATYANDIPRPPAAVDWNCYTGQSTVNIVILGPHAWKVVSVSQ